MKTRRNQAGCLPAGPGPAAGCLAAAEADSRSGRGTLAVVPFLALGVGCGLLGSGAGELLAAQAMKKHPELQKQQEINQKDERNVALGNAAKAGATT